MIEPTSRSTAAQWAPLAPFVRFDARLAAWARQKPTRRFLYEFLRFGIKQAWACLFGGIMVALLIGTHLAYPAHVSLSRYDFLFLAALTTQALLILTRAESLQEAGVILIYHVVGTAMEVFKTSVGSWSYPEATIFHIGAVPLFTGFMYASIGSYMIRAWTLFDFRFARHPRRWAVALVAVAIYANFFLDHFHIDMRWALFAASIALFWRTSIYFRVHHSWRSMPLLLSAFLAAIFIWGAENIGTITRTWLYPSQVVAWSPVALSKFGSWFLLQIVSYALVLAVRRPEQPDAGPVLASEERHQRRLGAVP